MYFPYAYLKPDLYYYFILLKKQRIYKRCELVDRYFQRATRHATKSKSGVCWHWGNLPNHICTDNQPSSKVTPVWQKQQCIRLHYMFPWHTKYTVFPAIQKSSYRHLWGCYSCSGSYNVIYCTGPSLDFSSFQNWKMRKKNNNINNRNVLWPLLNITKLLNRTKREMKLDHK